MSTARHEAPREWLSVAEVAALLGVCGKTVRRRIVSEGWLSRLDSVSTGPPLRLIRASDVWAYLQNTPAAAALDSMSPARTPSRDTMSLDNTALVRVSDLDTTAHDLTAALNRLAAALEAHPQPSIAPAGGPDFIDLVAVAIAGVLLGAGLLLLFL